MSKTRILLAAIVVLGLAGASLASDTPSGQQPPTIVVEGTISATTSPQSRCLPILSASTSCSTCPTACNTSAASCSPCARRGCLTALWSFFTYRRLPYTDINTYCCSCCEPARPPLFVYMLHPCADKAAPLTLPDLTACGGSCHKCGRHLEQGCSTCPTCGK